MHRAYKLFSGFWSFAQLLFVIYTAFSPPFNFEIAQLPGFGAYLVLSNIGPEFCNFCISEITVRVQTFTFEMSSHSILQICMLEIFHGAFSAPCIVLTTSQLLV